MQEGSYVGSLAPYGYIKDPADKHRLIPDPETAPFASRIFRLAAGGLTPSSIAALLNEKKIPSPSARKRPSAPCPWSARTVIKVLPSPSARKRPSAPCPWSARTVIKVLRNPVYLGHMAQGRSRKLSFRSGVTIANPREAWIMVKNTHEALTDPDTFFAAAALLDSRRCRSISSRPSPCAWGWAATPPESPDAASSAPPENGSWRF